jgi:phage/plasmid-associated DNA primase
MHIAEAQFNDHPHLLNTPEGVLNLETGALEPHPQPQYLMRHMTVVSPDLLLAMSYPPGQIPWSAVMPEFWSLLLHVSKDPQTGEHRPWVISALQRWLRKELIGELRHQ